MSQFRENCITDGRTDARADGQSWIIDLTNVKFKWHKESE